MKFRLLTICLCVAVIFPLRANAINLDCKTLTNNILQQLTQRGLLNGGDVGRAQTNTIIMNSCRGAEASAEKQHAESKEEWVKNWLFENTGGKPGNKRLRNLKR